MTRPILKYLFLLVGSFPLFLKAQMKPIEKVYIVEGVVADIETLKIIPSVIIFNDTLGITTTSDENGYFKVVAPYNLVRDKRLIIIDFVIKGYKRNG
ncbi:MAG: hypothetical protein A2546_06165 [Sphingobacteriia bacterium RIFOXYD2_FULL_35_12]|nr:MAG: hypothetical protein A2472_14070 [Sphingobacteriia bacterium RIFOXYC2_FULL_35_18]OHC88899.1 MAG: hypothetical protein A2546_06165 [Sphingobacteriia bacterium RIFOXYD2_FULL_35_12]